MKKYSRYTPFNPSVLTSALIAALICICFISPSEVSAKDKLSQKEADNVEYIYNSAVALFKSKLYRQAYENFKKVEEAAPDYKATADYLNLIDSIFEDDRNSNRRVGDENKAFYEEEQATLPELYKDGVRYYREKDYQSARQKFLEIQSRDKGYRASERYLEKIEQLLAKKAAEEMEENKADQMEAAAEEPEVMETEDEPEPRRAKRDSTKDKFINKLVSDDMVKELEKERYEQYKDEAEEKYQQAVKCYRKGKFIDSKIGFIQVQAILPGYRDTLAYLKKIDDDIAEMRAEEIEAYTPEVVDAQEAVEELQDEAIEDRMAASRSEVRDRRQEEEDKRVDDMYKEAVQEFKMRRYREAKQKFNELESVRPDHKSTRKYLEEIQGELAKLADMKMQETKIEQAYVEGVQSYKDKNYKTAKEKFETVLKLDDNNRSAKRYLSKVNKKLSKLSDKSDSPEKPARADHPNTSKVASNTADSSKESDAKEDELEGVYSDAVVKYRRAEFREAKRLFISVLAQDPSYKDTASYLDKVNERIVKELKRKEEQALRDLHAKDYSSLVDTRATDFKAWKKDFEERIAELQAHEEHAEALKGEMYEKFQKKLTEEWKILKDVLRERQRRIAKEKKRIYAQLEEKEAERVEAETELKELEEEEEKKAAEWDETKEQAELMALKQNEAETIERQEKLKELRMNEQKIVLEELALLEKEQEILEQLESEEEEIDTMVIQLANAVVRKEKELKEHIQYIEQAEKIINNIEAIKQSRDDRRKRMLAMIEEEADESVMAIVNYEQQEAKKQKAASEARELVSRLDDEQRRIAMAKKREYLKRKNKILKARKEADDIAQKKLLEQVEKIYDHAMDLYRDRMYLQAKIQFNAVENMAPGYKSAKAYVKKIESELEREKDRYKEKLLERKLEVEEEERRITYQENILSEARKELFSDISTKEEIAALMDEIERVYNEALRYFSIHQDKAAQTQVRSLEELLEHEVLSPEYRDKVRQAFETDKAETLQKRKEELARQREMEEKEREHQAKIREIAELTGEKVEELTDKHLAMLGLRERIDAVYANAIKAKIANQMDVAERERAKFEELLNYDGLDEKISKRKRAQFDRDWRKASLERQAALQDRMQAHVERLYEETIKMVNNDRVKDSEILRDELYRYMENEELDKTFVRQQRKYFERDYSMALEELEEAKEKAEEEKILARQQKLAMQADRISVRVLDMISIGEEEKAAELEKELDEFLNNENLDRDWVMEYRKDFEERKSSGYEQLAKKQAVAAEEADEVKAENLKPQIEELYDNILQLIREGNDKQAGLKTIEMRKLLRDPAISESYARKIFEGFEEDKSKVREDLIAERERKLEEQKIAELAKAEEQRALDNLAKSQLKQEVALIYQKAIFQVEDGEIDEALKTIDVLRQKLDAGNFSGHYIRETWSRFDSDRAEALERYNNKRSGKDVEMGTYKGPVGVSMPDGPDAEKEIVTAGALGREKFQYASIAEVYERIEQLQEEILGLIRNEKSPEEAGLTQELRQLLTSGVLPEKEAKSIKSAFDDKRYKLEEEVQAEKKKEAELAKQKKEELQSQMRAQLHEDAKKLYEVSLKSLADARIEEATAQYNEMTELLTHAVFDPDLAEKLKNDYEAEKRKILQKAAEPKDEPVELAKAEKTEAEATKSEEITLPEVDEKKQKELAELAEQIEKQELQLTREQEKKLEASRKQKERELEIARREEMQERLRRKRIERQKEREQERLRQQQAKREKMEEMQKLADAEADTEPETVMAEKVQPRESPSVQPIATRQKMEELSETGLDKITVADMERMTKDERIALERKRREDLRQMIAQRQAEIKVERERVQREFQESIDKLYVKAIQYYKQGVYASAYELFQEVNRMKPGYKKVDGYLKQIQKKNIKQPVMSKPSRALPSMEPVQSTAAAPRPRMPENKPESRFDVISDALDMLEGR